MSDTGPMPPSPWFDATECPRDGCDETRFVPLALDLHLLRDHDLLRVREGRP